jgi:alanyl-tRNA synthetase
MEFDRQPDGVLQPLPAPSIDTGMGLERITAVIQGKLSNYDTDLFTPILDAIGERAGRRYGASADDPGDVSMRVIADHLRAMTFLIADGVVPSNEWRGYVLRKIMRRAMRHGKKLFRLTRVSTTSSTWWSTRWARRNSQLVASRDAIVRVVRSERTIRRRADGRPAPPRRGPRPRRRGRHPDARRRGLQAGRLIGRATRLHEEDRPASGQRQIAFDRVGFDRAMEASG